MGGVIYYHETNGVQSDALQVESNPDEDNFNVVIREFDGEKYEYAGILLSRESALELVAKLTAELTETA